MGLEGFRDGMYGQISTLAFVGIEARAGEV
jgi:hypothetical protein